MLCYQTTKFQKILFRGADIGEVPAAAAGLADYERFVGDVFGRAYSADGIKANDHSPGLDIYEAMHRAAGEIPEWSGLVERTRNDSFLSGIVAAQIGAQLATVLPKDAEVGSAAAEQKLADTLTDMLAGMDPTDDGYAEMTHEKTAAAGRAAAAVKAAETVADAVDGAAMRNALRAAIKAAKGEVEAVVGGYSAFGCDPMAPDAEKRRIMSTLSDRMKQSPILAKIAELAGRLQRMMEGLKTEQVGKNPAEIVGVIQGNDVGRLLPSELCKLATSPKLFFKDMLENQLLQAKSRRTEETGRGPLVVCLDHSGSMRAGSRHLWASAIAVALMNEAKAQGRPFSVCLFNAEVTASWSFGDSGRTLDGLLDLVSKIPNGGTDISSAVAWAQGQVAMEPKADVVILSDGDDYMTSDKIEAVNSWKKSCGCKILAVRVAGDPSYTALDKISDKV
ncbi:MAG: VWA domain-containing protein, partial [Desulfobacterales bacterium]|nr:VWA domain-containing protein [Desulfobacterales bacterium]